MSDLSHTLEVRPNLFIRAFIKFYDLKYPYGLNTCKLFWGGIGMVILPLVFLALSPLILLLYGAGLLADKAIEARARKWSAYLRLSDAERIELGKLKTTRAEKLEKFSAWASAVWYKIATPVTWLFRIAVGLLVLVALGALVVAAINWAPGVDWGSVLLAAGVFLVAAATIGGIVLGGIYLYATWRERHPKAPKTKKPSVLKAVFASIHNHTCANVEVKS